MKHIFLINQNAYAINKNNLAKEIRAICIQMDLDYIILAESNHNLTLEYAKHYGLKYPEAIFYSVGGDGTLNDTLNGISDAASVIGVLPFGQNNDFFKMIANDEQDILRRTIMAGHFYENNNNFCAIPVNYGVVNKTDRFINGFSLGYGPEKIEGLKEYAGKGFHPFANELLNLEMMFHKEGFPVSLDIDGRIRKYDNLKALAVCSGTYYKDGFNYYNYPRRLNDDTFDLNVIANLSNLKMYLLNEGIFTTQEQIDYFIKREPIKKVTITSNRHLMYAVDGELRQKMTFGELRDAHKSKSITDIITVEAAKGFVKVLRPTPRA